MSKNKRKKVNMRNDKKVKKYSVLKDIMIYIGIFAIFALILALMILINSTFSGAYWLNTVELSIGCIVLFCSALGLFKMGIEFIKKDTAGLGGITVSFVLAILIGVLVTGIFLINLRPRLLDIPRALSHNYMITGGKIIAIHRNEGKKAYADITVQYEDNDGEITITFKGDKLTKLSEGQKIKIEYLPHSNLGMAYSIEN
ncbi:hypothetical protein [Clostridium sp. JS66]|uniref:hypothetical protein n=1 Tax=Clostridium sp. JS66 TaxID=3064705 RepID=UPI00298D7AE4|nr:hypothetical protein [Clostridium sp. JS66]WPC43881.1 hypothetical protein Q6H37_10500 [Clostridium sp. JS66]